MSQTLQALKTFWREEDGASEVVEALLLIGAVIVPMAYIIVWVAEWVAIYYSLNGYVISLPFP
jgi:Flp pilus assembly pilin Flp